MPKTAVSSVHNEPSYRLSKMDFKRNTRTKYIERLSTPIQRRFTSKRRKREVLIFLDENELIIGHEAFEFPGP